MAPSHPPQKGAKQSQGRLIWRYLSPGPEQLSRFGVHITAANTNGMVTADISVETRMTPATSSGRLSYMRA